MNHATLDLGGDGLFALGLSFSASADELKVGDAAPDFEMVGSDGKTYKLSDFKGKQAVVVAWYPRAFTAVAQGMQRR